MEDLAPEAMASSDGIAIRPLLPFGFGHVAVINGPSSRVIADVMSAIDPVHREPLINLFTPLMTGLSENVTDANFLFDSSPQGYLKRQRSLIPYIQDPARMKIMFTDAVQEFRKMLDQWEQEGQSKSLVEQLATVIYSVVGRNLFGFDQMPMDVLRPAIIAMEKTVNNGRPPNMFSSLSHAQQLTIESGKVYTKMATEILTLNRESILATDNYTHCILDQSAKAHGGNPEDFIIHGDVMSSSPLLFLGLANVPMSLSHTLLCLYTPSLCKEDDLIDRTISEVKQLSEETLAMAKASRSLDKLYLETLRAARPARLVVRMISKEMECGNRIVPAHTLVAVAQGALLEDKRHWGADANIFSPNRFDIYSPNVTGQNPKQYPFIPFSIGNRSCPGFIVANTICLAFFVAMFDGRYDIVLDTDHNPPPSAVNTRDGLASFPPEFRAYVKPRKNITA